MYTVEQIRAAGQSAEISSTDIELLIKILKERNKSKDLYYIQNSYVYIGNAMLWWKKDGKGYTTDITEAGKYTKAEIGKIIERPGDYAWSCEYIDENKSAKRLVIDRQHLHRDQISNQANNYFK